MSQVTVPRWKALCVVIVGSILIAPLVGCGGGGSGGGGSGSTSPPASLAAPTGLTATPGNTTVLLSWDAVSGATSYVIQREGVSVGSPSATNFTDSGLTNGTAYTYTVSATNGTVTSANSTQVSATPVAPASVPATPSGLTATAGNATVTLAWNVVAGATSYQVYRNGEPVGSPTTNTYSDAGLTNGTAYSYAVSAVNGAGASPESAPVSATPTGSPSPPTGPATPTGLSALAANASVGLSWNAVSGATRYNVTRNGALIASPTTNSFVDTGLVNGTTYTYTVAAANSSGTSAPSASVSAVPAGGQPPGIPTGLTGTPGQGTSVLTWNAVAGATRYNVYRSSSASGVGTLVGTPTLNMFADLGVAANVAPSNPAGWQPTSYYYVIAAVNAAGASGNSAQVKVAPNYLVPAAPENFVATAGNAQASLAWTTRSLNVTPASGFLIYRNNMLVASPATANVCTSSTIATGTVYSCNYTDTGLTNGTAYTYMAAGVSSLGQSPFAALRIVTPLAPPAVPYAPTGLTAAPGNAVVTLNWNTLLTGGVTSYKVYRNGTAVAAVTANPTTPATSYGYSDTGLTNGTSYNYKVSAVNTAAEGTVSLQVPATPSAAVPPAPTGVTAIPGNTFVTVNWNTVNTATGYNVYRNGALIGQTLVSSLTDLGLTNGTSYSYQVTATNIIGAGSQSTTAAATPLGTIIPAAGTYAQPYTVGFLGDPATLTVYAPPSPQGSGAGAVPPGCTGWESYGLRCDQTNILWDHVWIQGTVYWTGTGSMTVTNSIVEGRYGNAPIESHAVTPQSNAVITIADSTLRWMPGQVEPQQLGTGQIISISGLQLLALLRNDFSGMSQGPNPLSSSLFDSNYLHYWFQNLQVQGGVLQDAHLDGIFNEGADNTIYQRNYLDIPVRGDVSAAMFFQAQGTPNTSTGNKIYANFISGGGSLIGNQTGLSVDVINNTMGSYVYSVDGYTSDAGTFGTWSGNVSTDGSTVPVP